MFSVLHVDPSSFYKEIVKSMSLEKKFQYFSAKNPKVAFTILQSNEIDLIITSLHFKEESGETFIESILKSKYKRIPIIVLSSNDDINVKTSLFKLGVLDYLPKDNFAEYLMGYILKLQSKDSMHTNLENMEIAVLDDNALQLKIMKDILEEHNINLVDYYSHPKDLLESKKNYSIYLIDFILPHISGEQVIEEIRKKNQYCVIIAISAISNHVIMSNALSSGANDYILKPFSTNLFLARLKANVRTFSLLEELKHKNEALEQLVRTDGLTQLYNHKYMYERLQAEISRANRYASPLSVIMLDIDKFKRINDTYGHQTGDIVLIEISRFLKESLRNVDIVGRYGGEEFIIILPETNIKGAYILAERIRAGIESLSFSEPNLKVTISGGIAELNKHTAEELIKIADLLLYAAKQNGRNRIEYVLERTDLE